MVTRKTKGENKTQTVRTGGQKTAGLARSNSSISPEFAGSPLLESLARDKAEKEKRVAAERQLARPRVKDSASAKEKGAFRAYLRETKGIAKQMEKNNFTKIILFDSGCPWYKIAFNSLLIYEYRIMPHLKEVRFAMRPDSDSYYKSDEGVVGVGDLIAFADIMRKVGAKIPESLEACFDGNKIVKPKLDSEERERFYVFELEEMTRAKFETYFKARRRKAEDLNELVLPAYIPRELYPDAHGLAQEVAKMVSRFPREVREIYGRQVALLSINIPRDINIACNGYYGGKEGFMKVLDKTLSRAAEIQEILRILMDSRLISYGLCQSLTLLSLKVQKDALAERKALLAEDSKYVQAIKDAKNFPRVMNIDLSEEYKLNKVDDSYGYIETVQSEE
ncbi:hypothetical protein IJ765_01895 [Candidatus Saccharibacteria bacterium]|nr:hypothetical protein [Candidatus Saccharibacteria bacterium]